MCLQALPAVVTHTMALLTGCYGQLTLSTFPSFGIKSGLTSFVTMRPRTLLHGFAGKVTSPALQDAHLPGVRRRVGSGDRGGGLRPTGLVAASMPSSRATAPSTPATKTRLTAGSRKHSHRDLRSRSHQPFGGYGRLHALEFSYQLFSTCASRWPSFGRQDRRATIGWRRTLNFRPRFTLGGNWV